MPGDLPDNGRDVWTVIDAMQNQIKETRDAVFGYYMKTDAGTVRVKGLLENQSDMISEFASWKENLMTFGWAVGKPVIGLLAVLVALGFIGTAIVVYAFIHGGLRVSL